MAPIRKRKANDVGQATSEAAREARNKRARASTTLKALDSDLSPPQDREDLLQKLPAEIRNNIYELVLIQDLPIRVRFPKYLSPREKSETQAFEAESGLLRASKWLRSETIAIFYHRNDFQLGFTMRDSAKAYGWMTSIARACGSYKFNVTRMRLMQPKWKDINYCLPIARAVHELGFSLQKVRLPRSRTKVPSILVTPNVCRRMESVMNQVLLLGLKARRKGWSGMELEMGFAKLVDELATITELRTVWRECRWTWGEALVAAHDALAQ